MGLCNSRSEQTDGYQYEPVRIKARRVWSDNHLNKELTLVTNGIPGNFQYECMQWNKLKLDVYITTCWTRVIWDDWKEGVEIWPQRCESTQKLLIRSMYISNAIKSLTLVCPKCDIEVHQSEFKIHKEKWKKLYYERINFVGAICHIDNYSESKISNSDTWRWSSRPSSPRNLSSGYLSRCNWIKEFQFCTDWILQSVY
jgi:hypothetical protein